MGTRTTLATLPTPRKIASMSDPQLVAVIRRLQREHVIYRLKNDGKEPPTGPLLRAAMDQADIRRIEILHPELS